MKRILSVLTAAVVIFLFLPVNLDAQDEKIQKKIKIIVDDGSGQKTIIDTVLTDGSDIETIKTAEGKIIFISSDGPDHMKDGKDSKHVTVTVTSDNEGQVHTGNDNVAVWTEKGESPDVEKIIVVKKGNSADNHIEKNIDVVVTTNDDSTVENARFVVAKDGMIVTVEGEDENRARELMKVIEEYLGAKEKDVKTETKKNSKK